MFHFCKVHETNETMKPTVYYEIAELKKAMHSNIEYAVKTQKYCKRRNRTLEPPYETVFSLFSYPTALETNSEAGRFKDCKNGT